MEMCSVGSVIVRGPDLFIRIWRSSVRQVEYSVGQVKVWFEAEENPYSIALADTEEDLEAMIFSDIIDESKNVVWRKLNDKGNWCRNGVDMERKHIA